MGILHFMTSGKTVTELRDKQEIRLRRAALGLLAYMIPLGCTLISALLGMTPWLSVIIMSTGMLLACGSVIYMVKHGWNLKFSDPSLTKFQLIISGFVIMPSVHFMGSEREIIMLSMAVALSFGAFRLSGYELGSLCAALIGWYTLDVWWVLTYLPGVLDLKRQILMIATMIVVGGWLSFFSGMMYRFRKQMRQINGALQEANEHVHLSKAHLKSLLDHSGEGFLSVAPDKTIGTEFSQACLSMLGTDPAGKGAGQLIFAEDMAAQELFDECMARVFNSTDAAKQGLMLSLLPPETSLNDRTLAIRYRLIENGHLMVVLDDVTEARTLEREVKLQHARMEMMLAAASDPATFQQTVHTLSAFFDHVLNNVHLSAPLAASELRELYRVVHTFKGNAAQFSMHHTVEALHRLESDLSDLSDGMGKLQPRHIQTVVARASCKDALQMDLQCIRDVLGDGFIDGFRDEASELKQLAGRAREWLRRNGSPDLSPVLETLLRDLVTAVQPPLSDTLASYARTVLQTAAGTGKHVAPLQLEGDIQVRLDPDDYPDVFPSLVHIFRNGVVHGIEAPADRLALGKPSIGTIRCRVNLLAGSIELCIEDDGSGIPEHTLLAKYSQRTGGVVQADIPSLLDLICMDGLSSRETADHYSGRGIGMGAVRLAIERCGGQLHVSTAAGAGTQFRIQLPYPAHPAATHPSRPA
ncbi:Hpt domain-containing protein [Burkholderiaceae bacterium DAT-1]|nr:Hpt domain-containing protein [Burkholderiaceae bacterium DAT-1]